MDRTCLGDLSLTDFFVTDSESCESIEKLFKNNPTEKGVVVVDEHHKMVAAIARYSFVTLLSSAFGRELFLKKNIGKVCRKNPEICIHLYLEEDTAIHSAITKAIDRPIEQRYDPIVVLRRINVPALIDIETLLWVHLRETEYLNKQLSKANRDKNEMLGIASHDLKNPLGVISTMAEMMLTDQLDAELQKEFLTKIGQNSKKMLNIIASFIDASRVEGQLFVPVLKPFKLDNFLKELIDSHRIAANAKEQTFIIQCENFGEIEITSDQNHVQSVMDNLLSNAVKYTPRQGGIKVKVWIEGKRFIFEVKDSGPGISPDDQKKMFKKFTRLSAQPTGGESSTGLGLFTVRKICSGLGAQVSVASQLGVGSTFRFELPL
jgi:signal transduction histidine kinase